MKINNTLYFDLKIPKLNMRNFLTADNLIYFEMVESAGTSLPFVIVTFKTYSEQVKESIKQNNEVEVCLGKTEENSDTFKVTIWTVEIDQGETDRTWEISFGGFIGPSDFMVHQYSKTYEGNSLSVAKEIINQYFKKGITTNIDKVNENQIKWRNDNKSARAFLLDVILHMDISPSVPLFTFDKYGNFKLYSLEKLVKDGYKHSLTPRVPSKSNQYMYINNFQLNSYKAGYNAYWGHNRITNINMASLGGTKTAVVEKDPQIASTKVSETKNVGVTYVMNNIQTDNVHNTYKECYNSNVSKIWLLSSMGGEVLLVGGYYNKIEPLDFVYLENDKKGSAESGYYIVDTVTTFIDTARGVLYTSLYLSRDNRNFIEDHINEEKGFLISTKDLKELMGSVSRLKSSYAFALEVIGGDYLNSFLNFGISAKNNLLRCFSIGDVRVDLTSNRNMISTLILEGNSLFNSLCYAVFPQTVADTLKDYVLYQKSFTSLFYDFISRYVPPSLVDTITGLFTSLFDTTKVLNSIAENNGVDVSSESNLLRTEVPAMANTTPVVEETITEAQKRVNDIINDFENNTTGLDIPFPDIGLTESQALYSDKELRNYLASQTVQNLTDLNYVKSNEDAEELKDILLGNQPINFSLINRINKNAGDGYYFRYWGTFGSNDEALYAWSYENNTVYTKTDFVKRGTRLYLNDKSPYDGKDFYVDENDKGEFFVYYLGNETSRDLNKDINSNALAELTSFFIKKGYKDKYRTIPCTKFIDATHNQRIFFACPSRELDDTLKFYINSKRVILQYFPINLGMVDTFGNNIEYYVFYTEQGYNSNSVIFEVRKG